MKRLPVWTVLWAAVVGWAGVAAGESAPSKPWQRMYQGDDAVGPNVIGLWRFLPGKETLDDSERGHDVKLRGESRFVPGGLFGNCLESFRAGPVGDAPNGAVVRNAPDLSPPGAFTLEMWIKPKPELDECPTAFLMDKKYYPYPKDLPQANHDYCLYLRRTGPAKYRLIAFLGYGRDSAEYVSREIALSPMEWTHVAFTYNGAGVGRFFVNGEPFGRVVHKDRGPISPGNYDLVIGDRYGSIHAGFPGWIDQVRIVNGIPAWFAGGLEVAAAPLGRTAFLRMEAEAAVELLAFNDAADDARDVAVVWDVAGIPGSQAIPVIPRGGETRIAIPIDTRWRPDRYPLRVTVSGKIGDRTATSSLELEVVVAPRPLPDVMPVVMWGTGDLDRLQEIGFTHQLISAADYDRIWRAGEPTSPLDDAAMATRAAELNRYLARGVGAVVSLSPAAWIVRDAERGAPYRRVDRNGQPYKDANPCGLFPEVSRFCYNVGASVGEAFGRFPAVQAALIDTEVRDSTNLCFHEHDRAAFRAFAGYDIPDQAVSKWGLKYASLSNFPADRVIADDDPLLTYYRWFWKEGDGWNALHSAVHRGLKEHGRKEWWTFFDPAVRAPSVWGSGGETDFISQWTYSYPDPIKIGQAADELFAMAEGRPGQNVMKMTQIIWYRSQTAPELPQDESRRADWEKRIPDARFITISPDHLREAFWAKISRPVRGIMYHGWGSLVEAEHGAYRYTHPQTKEVLAELIRDVVRPLGPTLLQVPDAPADVAILESFTSQMFAGRGTYGWGKSWEADLHLVLQWAHLQPKVIFEETLLRDGLDGCKVLVLPACDVLPRSVVERIRVFQAAGGIVVGDEELTPALQPDVVLPAYRRTGAADRDKAELQALAQRLREALDSRYTRRVDASEADAVVRLRQYGAASYVFVLNDRRTFGDYVGHHGKVMEVGLPLQTAITLQAAGTVYDPLARRAAAIGDGPPLRWTVELGPGDGRLFIVLPRPIAAVECRVPAEARRGETIDCDVRILDADGKAIPAVLPVEVILTDPLGRRAEPSGYYAAKDGSLNIRFDSAPNDEPGEWTLYVRELAGGASRECVFTLR
ncbi:LamG-like jellyroll fold domain-containing protein [Thermopirellula anaerolimosa]